MCYRFRINLKPTNPGALKSILTIFNIRCCYNGYYIMLLRHKVCLKYRAFQLLNLIDKVSSLFYPNPSWPWTWPSPPPSWSCRTGAASGRLSGEKFERHRSWCQAARLAEARRRWEAIETFSQLPLTSYLLYYFAGSENYKRINLEEINCLLKRSMLAVYEMLRGDEMGPIKWKWLLINISKVLRWQN